MSFDFRFPIPGGRERFLQREGGEEEEEEEREALNSEK